MTREIGIIGLGRMGAAMAATLVARGWTVLGWDSAPEARRHTGVKMATDLPSLIAGRHLLLLSLPDSAAVESVVLGDPGVLSLASADTLVIDCSTADPASTRRLQAALAARQIGFVDAPVSGGPAGAASGTLTVMMGGEPAMLERAMEVFDDLARAVHRVGGPGAGNVAKLVNNLLVAGQLMLVAEALALGEAAGVPAGALVDTVNGCSGRSAITELNLPRWVLSKTFDSGFSAGLMRKDVGLALTLAEQMGLSPRLLPEVEALWAQGVAELGGEVDFNCMVPWIKAGAPG